MGFPVLFRKKNYKKLTGWGAGQPGFPCLFSRKLFSMFNI